MVDERQLQEIDESLLPIDPLAGEIYYSYEEE